MNIKIIPEDIKNYIKYDETSKSGLRWINTTSTKCTIKIGDEAGSQLSNNYYQIKFKRKKYQAHRIVFFLHNGYCPDIIDHIDNNKSNNNIDNLREATRSQNQMNRKNAKTSTTGIKGITRMTNHNGIKYYRISLMVDNNYVFRKCYDATKFTLDDCRKIIEEKRLEFHKDYSRN